MKLSKRMTMDRRGSQQATELYAAAAKAGHDRICTCGKRQDEHDIAEDFSQPCAETGCKDFTPRGGQ